MPPLPTGPRDISCPIIRRFHRPALRSLVPTLTRKGELLRRGFEHLDVWGRGVDTKFFPIGRVPRDRERSVCLSVGRMTPEKNLEGLLALDLPGTRIVVGDGPQRAELRQA